MIGWLTVIGQLEYFAMLLYFGQIVQGTTDDESQSIVCTKWIYNVHLYNWYKWHIKWTYLHSSSSHLK